MAMLKRLSSAGLAFCITCTGFAGVTATDVYAQSSAVTVENSANGEDEVLGTAPLSEVSKYDASLKAFRDAMNKAMADRLMDNASAAVIENGEVIYSEGFGIIDDTPRELATGNTVYGIGSLSKVYTAAAVMKLTENDRVELDNPVINYIPEFKMADAKYKGITVGMLLNHTSGLPSDTDPASVFRAETALGEDTCDRLLKALENETLKSDPGEYAAYSNDGYMLAQRVVENVTKKSFPEYLRETFFSPMGLGSTGVLGITNFEARNNNNEIKAHIAHRFNTEGKPMPLEVPSRGIIGAGGIASTAVETALFIDKLLSAGSGILMEDSIKNLSSFALKSAELGEASLLSGYGFDFTTNTMFGHKVLSKSGGTYEYTAQMYTVPDSGLTVVGLASADMDVSPIYDGIAQLTTNIMAEKYADSDNDSEPARTEAAAVPSGMGKFSGVYAGMQSGAISLSVEGNKLVTSELVDGTWTKTREDSYMSDGTFGGISFIEADGEKFAAIDGLAYFQKLDDARENKEWAQLNDTLWLATGVDRKDYGFEEFIAGKIYSPGNMSGYVVFDYSISNVVQKITNNSAAAPGAEIMSGKGTLRKDGGKLSLGSIEYVDAGTVPDLPDSSIRLQEDDTAEWYEVPSGRKINLNPSNKDTRFIAVNEDGDVIFDSMRQSGSIVFSDGGYLMLSGAKGTEIGITSRLD